MPIKIGKRTFENFVAAVNYIIESKGFTKAQAEAYVASIERKQHPKKHKRKKKK